MTFCYLSASSVGNCPFRWSDLITNTLKSKIEKIVPPTTSPPRVDYGMPLTGQLLHLLYSQMRQVMQTSFNSKLHVVIPKIQ